MTNLSDEAMPLAIGYRPFFQIPDIPRDEWLARYLARIHVIPGEHNIPTGEMRPLDLPNPLPLRGRTPAAAEGLKVKTSAAIALASGAEILNAGIPRFGMPLRISSRIASTVEVRARSASTMLGPCPPPVPSSP